MEVKFTGKTVLVTGASQGIGRDLVKALVKCEARVIAAARSLEKLESLKKELPTIKIISVDLADWKATDAALHNVGPIDLLVNNAGLAILKALEDHTEEDIDRLFAINVKALMHVTQIVAAQLLSRKTGGSMVNVSSQASMAGLLGHAAYCATKGAVDAYTRQAAVELGPKGIRVNSVNPTVIMTDMGRLGWSDANVAGPMLQKIPLRRFGEVQEVVDAILYLLSDKASMINGVCLPIDGGFLAG